MENLHFLISKFEEEFDEGKMEQGEKLRQEFLEKFPLENLINLPLEKYALGLDNKDENLCWWLEYNSVILGSIKGGSAKKHKIYYSSKNDSWVYPEGFDDVKKAWQQLRKELYEFLIEFKNQGYKKVDSKKIISTMYADRSKLLYMYFPEKVLPIYNLDHIKRALKYFGNDNKELKGLDINQANLKLKKIMNKYSEFDDWSNFKFMKFAYKKIIYDSNYYKIAPGEEAKHWGDCFENNYIRLGWDSIGDLKEFADYDEFLYKFRKTYNDYEKRKGTEKANEVWTFYSLKPGDILIANQGTNKVVGIGEVNEDGYYYDDELNEYRHIIGVDWRRDFQEKEIPPKKYWAFKTIYEVSEDIYKEIVLDDENGNDKLKPEMDFKEIDKKIFKQIEVNLDRKGNVILQGPPGTGKTYLSLQYLKWKEKTSEIKIQEEFVTFHPSFSYEDFIEGYRPVSTEGQPDFKLKDGIFKNLCNEAAENEDTEYFLIIDEINRGDVAKIFGEMITLIEKDKRGYNITLSQRKEKFSVPENVYIIATMNTSDKSIKVMDAALRRRFGFIECMPQYELVDSPVEKLDISPKDILKKINKDLREIEDREKQIGHAYFMKDDKQVETVNDLREVYVYEVIPLVVEYCYNEYDKVGEIIGESFIDKDNEKLKDDLMQLEDFFINTIREKFGE